MTIRPITLNDDSEWLHIRDALRPGLATSDHRQEMAELSHGRHGTCGVVNHLFIAPAPQSVALVDLDKDGRLDLLGVGDGGHVGVLINRLA